MFWFSGRSSDFLTARRIYRRLISIRAIPKMKLSRIQGEPHVNMNLHVTDERIHLDGIGPLGFQSGLLQPATLQGGWEGQVRCHPLLYMESSRSLGQSLDLHMPHHRTAPEHQADRNGHPGALGDRHGLLALVAAAQLLRIDSVDRGSRRDLPRTTLEGAEKGTTEVLWETPMCGVSNRFKKLFFLQKKSNENRLPVVFHLHHLSNHFASLLFPGSLPLGPRMPLWAPAGLKPSRRGDVCPVTASCRVDRASPQRTRIKAWPPLTRHRALPGPGCPVW